MAKRIIIVIAVALVVIGLALFIAVMAANHWDFSALGGESYETVTHEVQEEFRSIRIDTDVTNITFALSEDGACRVECSERENETYSVAVAGDTLTIRRNDTRKGLQFFGFGEPAAMTVYLPKTEYDALQIEESTGNIEVPDGFAFTDIRIKASTGNIRCFASASGEITITASTGNISASDLSADSIALSVSTGNVTVSGVNCVGDLGVAVSTGRTELTGVRCGSLTSTGSTGRIELHDVIAAGRLSVKRSTGDVKFDRCDAAEISVETSTGDVSGTLLSDKIFFTKTDTGDVSTPKTTTGGTCEIHTDTGDIRIEIAK